MKTTDLRRRLLLLLLASFCLLVWVCCATCNCGMSTEQQQHQTQSKHLKTALDRKRTLLKEATREEARAASGAAFTAVEPELQAETTEAETTAAAGDMQQSHSHLADYSISDEVNNRRFVNVRGLGSFTHTGDAESKNEKPDLNSSSRSNISSSSNEAALQQAPKSSAAADVGENSNKGTDQQQQQSPSAAAAAAEKQPSLSKTSSSSSSSSVNSVNNSVNANLGEFRAPLISRTGEPAATVENAKAPNTVPETLRIDWPLDSVELKPESVSVEDFRAKADDNADFRVATEGEASAATSAALNSIESSDASAAANQNGFDPKFFLLKAGVLLFGSALLVLGGRRIVALMHQNTDDYKTAWRNAYSNGCSSNSINPSSSGAGPFRIIPSVFGRSREPAYQAL